MMSSGELKTIENDYIKNLQQQVYFLELEANYLREQAKKATEMHPKMTAEAERMLYRLRVRGLYDVEWASSLPFTKQFKIARLYVFHCIPSLLSSRPLEFMGYPC